MSYFMCQIRLKGEHLISAELEERVSCGIKGGGWGFYVGVLLERKRKAKQREAGFQGHGAEIVKPSIEKSSVFGTGFFSPSEQQAHYANY